MWIAKKKFPQNTIKKIAHPQTKKGRRTPDLRLPLTRNECQSVKWKGWYSVFTGIPNFSLFISTAWLNSPLNKATRDTCDLHNHTFPEQPFRQNLNRKFWKLERVAYLAMETDETMFADQFAGHFTIACARGPRGEEHLTIAWVKWVLELEIRVEWKSVKVKKMTF